MHELIGFDSGAGASLTGWQQGVTGRGAARWTVEQDDSAPSRPNVLRQSGVGSFPWIVLGASAIEDGYVDVKFKALAGKEDQAGGVLWRWKGGDHYYVARANALENNVSLYYTEAGRRNTRKYVDAPVPPLVWHTLRVEFSGRRITVALNGRRYIDFDDSVTAFDDFGYGTSP